jgi:hypothetical protein
VFIDLRDQCFLRRQHCFTTKENFTTRENALLEDDETLLNVVRNKYVFRTHRTVPRRKNRSPKWVSRKAAQMEEGIREFNFQELAVNLHHRVLVH